jgi:hypothetical protein
MSSLAQKSISLSALVTVVLGLALGLMLPAISAGAGGVERKPRLSIIIHGTGHDFYEVTYVGNRSAACRPGRPVDATVGAGRAGNELIVGQAFCDRFSVARATGAVDPGSGAFASVGPQTGRQTSGPPECVGKYDPRNSAPDSAWVAVCRFF